MIGVDAVLAAGSSGDLANVSDNVYALQVLITNAFKAALVLATPTSAAAAIPIGFVWMKLGMREIHRQRSTLRLADILRILESILTQMSNDQRFSCQGIRHRESCIYIGADIETFTSGEGLGESVGAGDKSNKRKKDTHF